MLFRSGSEARQLRHEITERLLRLRRDGDDRPVIRDVYNSHRVYQGPYRNAAPDLIIGYEKGYRVSWDAAVGRVTENVFSDNTKAWSGDHCIDPALVPGVLFCNRPVEDDRPRLMDVGPTVLDLFGLEVPSHMDGLIWRFSDGTKNGDSRQKNGELRQKATNCVENCQKKSKKTADKT